MGSERYHVELAAAFVRGRLPFAHGTPEELIEQGLAHGLRLHKFKRDSELPRVRVVVGALLGIAPATLLDIGSGRGTFLWPLLASLPSLDVTAIDLSAQRASDVDAVRRGGFSNLNALRADARALAFADDTFDVVTMLEVLEHMERPSDAIRETVRVAKRFVIVSVPSKDDDNPEHIHLFDNPALESMLLDAGTRRVRFDSVLNHRIAIAAL
jgi:2-polyprenyl-3-methyl-5-hydroxy-6-metoxy-1,4-benzoquinol methylase